MIFFSNFVEFNKIAKILCQHTRLVRFKYKETILKYRSFGPNPLKYHALGCSGIRENITSSKMSCPTVIFQNGAHALRSILKEHLALILGQHFRLLRKFMDGF